MISSPILPSSPSLSDSRSTHDKIPQMRWLHSPFSSSSKSHSPSASNPNPDSEIQALLSRLALFSRGNQRLRPRQQRRLTRTRKLRHLPDEAVGPHLHRSSSAQDQLSSAQPLPLPDFAVLLKRNASTDATINSSDSNSSSGKVPLPSPHAPSRTRGGFHDEKRKIDSFNGDAARDGVAPLSLIGSRSLHQEAEPISEHFQINPSGKSPQKKQGRKQNQGKYRIDIPNNAPTSYYSFSALSPLRNAGEISAPYYMSPQAFQVYSAPDLPPTGSAQCLDVPYRTAFSLDNSPVNSPRESPPRSTRSSNGHALQSSFESSGQVTVHPLPLPPGVMAQQSAAAPTFSPKPEVMPMKSQWQKGKLIGRGTFGSVYVASNRETGALCAMKEVEILPDDSKSAERIRQLEQEIKVLSRLTHPNIVQYYGSEIVSDHFYIYLEYVHPGSINRYISEHCGAITESIVRNFTRHILCGLAYLHSTKTIHRDIKGANLLVDANGVVKLADFGMAKHIAGQVSYLSMKGSPYWMAPELLQSGTQKDSNSDLALAVDIWSLGCTIIEMLNRKPPWSEFEGAAAMFKVLKEIPPIPETLSVEGKDFLRHCFLRNPAERPSASKLLEHQFVKNSQVEKTQTPREHSNYKLDLLPISSNAHATKAIPPTVT